MVADNSVNVEDVFKCEVYETDDWGMEPDDDQSPNWKVSNDLWFNTVKDFAAIEDAK